MKRDIENNEQLRERTKYVPASMKVIEVTPQIVLCGSRISIDNPDNYPGNEM